MLKQQNAHAQIRIARGSNQCHGCRPGNFWPVATSGVRDREQWFPTVGGAIFDPGRHFRSSSFHFVSQLCGPGCEPVLQYLARGRVLTTSKWFNFFLRATSSHSNNDAPAHTRVVRRLSHAAMVLLPNPDGSDMKLLLAQTHYLEVVNKWWSKYRGMKPQAVP